MSIQDLLKGKIAAAPATATIELDGIGTVEVYQLTTAERFEYESDIEKLSLGEMSEEGHFDKWIPRILFGPGTKLKAAQLKNLKNGLNETAERKIFTTARLFPVDEAAKK